MTAPGAGAVKAPLEFSFFFFFFFGREV